MDISMHDVVHIVVNIKGESVRIEDPHNSFEIKEKKLKLYFSAQSEYK